MADWNGLFVRETSLYKPWPGVKSLNFCPVGGLFKNPIAKTFDINKSNEKSFPTTAKCLYFNLSSLLQKDISYFFTDIYKQLFEKKQKTLL